MLCYHSVLLNEIYPCLDNMVGLETEIPIVYFFVNLTLIIIIYTIGEDNYCNLEKFSFKEYYQRLFVMFAFRFYDVSQLCSIIKHATYQILLISFLFH